MKETLDPFWEDVEQNIIQEVYATSLRKDQSFSDKVYSSLLSQLVFENEKLVSINDKKVVYQIMRIFFSLLTKGKFENQNIDITRNQDLLNLIISIFVYLQKDEDLQNLNDIVKVIGLFAKFYCYYTNGADISFCATFLKYIPTIIGNTSKPTSVHINTIKAVGIMITVANMFPKRSLMFYRTFQDNSISTILINIIMKFKNVPNNYVLVKSSIESLAVLINPMNGDVFSFPFFKQENEKEISYLEYKTTFEHLNQIKESFFVQMSQSGLTETLPVLYECDSDGTLRGAILRVSIRI